MSFEKKTSLIRFTLIMGCFCIVQGQVILNRQQLTSWYPDFTSATQIDLYSRNISFVDSPLFRVLPIWLFCICGAISWLNLTRPRSLTWSIWDIYICIPINWLSWIRQHSTISKVWLDYILATINWLVSIRPCSIRWPSWID